MDIGEDYHWKSMMEYYNSTDRVCHRDTHADKEGSNKKQNKKIMK